jgi:hypothetical protein
MGVQRRLHHELEHHQELPVILPELNVSKYSICRPDMCLDIHHFPLRNLLLSMYLPQDSQDDADCDPNVLTDEGTVTG